MGVLGGGHSLAFHLLPNFLRVISERWGICRGMDVMDVSRTDVVSMGTDSLLEITATRGTWGLPSCRQDGAFGRNPDSFRRDGPRHYRDDIFQIRGQAVSGNGQCDFASSGWCRPR